MRNNAFSTIHPAVIFTWFTAVLLFSMFFMHPVLIAVSLVCSFGYSIVLNGKKAVRFNLLYMLPLLLFMAALNPAFNHAGVTILFYLPNGNPITLESILYGAAAAAMFISVIMWFACYNAVMTSDKFIYLFGRIIPALRLFCLWFYGLCPGTMRRSRSSPMRKRASVVMFRTVIFWKERKRASKSCPS